MSELIVKAKARALAIEYGYLDDSTAYQGLRAPLGKFEGEPFYTPYFYDLMMDGEGEPLYVDDRCEGTLFDVWVSEHKAFELDAGTVAIVLWHSEQGFETLEELTADRAEAIARDNNSAYVYGNI
jgi:hypothetical protein